MRWSCSVNTVDQGYLIEQPYLYITSSNSAGRFPIRARMPVTLVAGPNTIRLRVQITGGIPAAVSVFKSAAAPLVLALIKRP
jgi:hypothetical protein